MAAKDSLLTESSSLRLLLFCGGSGTRLWPVSRAARPKQFQPLVADKSLFQMMVDRLAGGFGIENVFVSTGTAYRDLILEQAPQLPGENLILEPEMRDTLAAVGYAVTVLDHRFPGSTVATLWGADHVIRNEETFVQALRTAAEVAQEHSWVVKIDVPPTYPNTGLGYIETGPKMATVDGFDFFEFVRQIEKPDHERARQFVADGRFFWNTGYIVWTTTKILELYRQHVPEVAERLSVIAACLGAANQENAVAVEFPKIEKLSIDYGLFQKMGGREFAVMPAELGWSDIGAWDVLRDELIEDPEGNIVRGHHLEIDTHNSLIYGPPGKTIVTIGVDDLIVVDTDDALLICPANRSQDVKRIVERLKREDPDRV